MRGHEWMVHGIDDGIGYTGKIDFEIPTEDSRARGVKGSATGSDGLPEAVRSFP